MLILSLFQIFSKSKIENNKRSQVRRNSFLEVNVGSGHNNVIIFYCLLFLVDKQIYFDSFDCISFNFIF